jgi:hypothetical protein
MDTIVEKLRREIEELERQIASHPFEGLFDKKRSDQMYQKLRKKRKELARAEGRGGQAAPTPGGETPAAALQPARVIPATKETPAPEPVAVKKTAVASTRTKANGRPTSKTPAARPRSRASESKTRNGKRPTGKATPAIKKKTKKGQASVTRKSAAATKKQK